eukprot:3544667-Prymnesium_polylepis.2
MEFRSHLQAFRDKRDAVASDYLAYDRNFIDHSTFTATRPTSTTRPTSPPPPPCRLRVTSMTLPRSSPALERHFAAVDDHSDWLAFYRHLRSGRASVSTDDDTNKRAAYFISTCQPGAGDYLDCLPSTSNQPTDLARLATQRRFRIRLNPPPPAHLDPWGDEAQNAGQHTTRHTDTNEMWASAFRYCFGSHNLKIDPRNQGGAVEWSPGHITDITAFNKAEGGFHVCADIKVGNVFRVAV